MDPLWSNSTTKINWQRFNLMFLLQICSLSRSQIGLSRRIFLKKKQLKDKKIQVKHYNNIIIMRKTKTKALHNYNGWFLKLISYAYVYYMMNTYVMYITFYNHQLYSFCFQIFHQLRCILTYNITFQIIVNKKK